MEGNLQNCKMHFPVESKQINADTNIASIFEYIDSYSGIGYCDG